MFWRISLSMSIIRLIWPPIENLLRANVVFVRIKLLEFLANIESTFSDSPFLIRFVDQVLFRYAEDTDPAIRALIKDARLRKMPRSASMESCGQRPVSRERQTPRIPKSGTPACGIGRAVLRERRDVLIRRPNSLRAPSTVFAPGSARGIYKGASDGNLKASASGRSRP
jgi:hypothetical protein